MEDFKFFETAIYNTAVYAHVLILADLISEATDKNELGLPITDYGSY